MKKCLGWLTIFLGIVWLSGCDRSSQAPVSVVPSGSPPAQKQGANAEHSQYAAEWIDNNIPQTMQAGVSLPVQVRVKNTADWTWPDVKAANPSKPDGSYAVRLTYRWQNNAGLLLPENPGRGELKASVPAGETAVFSMDVVPPKEPGAYQLQVDLVHELVAFFSAKGVAKLVVPVTVQ